MHVPYSPVPIAVPRCSQVLGRGPPYPCTPVSPPPSPSLPTTYSVLHHAVRRSPAGELDEEESRGGLKLTSDRRQALMARLATSAGMAPPPISTLPGMGAPPAAAAAVPAGPRLDPALGLIQSVLGPASPIPTPCLLIKNMFEPQAAEAESGPGWAEEIAADLQDECAKYGAILHVHVDKNSKVGHVGRVRDVARGAGTQACGAGRALEGSGVAWALGDQGRGRGTGNNVVSFP